MEASEEGSYCRAGIAVEGGGAFLLLANSGGDYGIGVQGKIGRGRKGVLQTEAFAVDFKPTYGGKDYVYSDDPIDSPTVFALRRAKALTVRLDGRLVLDIVLEGTGHDQLMTDLLSCAKGQSGWWGKGAPQG